ncbi:MAG: hypothetical protein QW641_00725 [Candidatus Aenigmatarchaeota archaeon]
MGGIIHHLTAAIISFFLAYKFFKRKDYSIAIFIGNFLPDAIGFIYASFITLSINPFIVLHSKAWFSLERDTITQSIWIILQCLFIFIYLLYSKSSKKRSLKIFNISIPIEKQREFEDMLGLLLAGFTIHMIMDMLIIESGILI